MLYQLRTEKDTDVVFRKVDYLLNTYRLPTRFQNAINSLPREGRNCAITQSKQAVDDLFSIAEYFSVSNDGVQKMMLSDAYPGQKKEFIMEGLHKVDSDFDGFISCYERYYDR